MKILGAVDPNGAVAFVSRGYGGRADDDDVTEASGFLELLEELDVILADRGFLVEHECNNRHAKLLRPPFSWKGQKHFTQQDSELTSGIARFRIIVERAFARIQQWAYLQKEIKLTSTDIADIAFRVVAQLTNYCPSLLKTEIKEQYFK